MKIQQSPLRTSTRCRNCAVLIGTVLFMILADFAQALAAERIAILPFRNYNGSLEFAEPSYSLPDSLHSMMQPLNDAGKIDLVPIDSVEIALASLNLDPNNPQYESDMWRAVEMLNVDKVVTGTYNVKYKKIFVNAYIYDVESKIRDPKHQAVNIFKKYDKALETVAKVYKKLAAYFDPK